jgi:hypothetical protein
MASRKYQKSLDFDLQYITVASLQKGDVGETVYIHDSANDIQRWNAVSIYEDMFTNFMSCEIVLVDQDGLFLNRFRTEEVIAIRFATPDLEGENGKTFETRTHYFYLYKIDPVVILSKPNGAVYSLKGVSFELFYNSLRTFSKSYPAGKTENIAESIYKEFLEAKSERTIKKTFKKGKPTKHEMKFVFPFVNPVDAINHLASVSISDANPDVCNYVFFENMEGFQFKSITEMIESPRKVHSYRTSRTTNTPFANFPAYFNNTITVTPQRTNDKIIDSLDGVYGEYFSDFDLMYKSYKPYIKSSRRGGDQFGKRYLEYFPKTTHLNSQPLLSKENEVFEFPLGKNRICLTNKALYAEERQLPNNQKEWKIYQTHEEEYSFQRRSMMQQINGFTVELSVPGNSDITVGDIAELDTVIYRTSDKDLYLSGRYLITAVHHAINLDGYKTIMTISRDSIKSSDFTDKSDAGE